MPAFIMKLKLKRLEWIEAYRYRTNGGVTIVYKHNRTSRACEVAYIRGFVYFVLLLKGLEDRMIYFPYKELEA